MIQRILFSHLGMLTKVFSGSFLLGTALTIMGCSQTVSADRPPAPATQSTTAKTTAKAASSDAPRDAEEKDAEETAQTVADKSQSASSIVPGRYWIGSTGQALEVEETRYRYVYEDGEDPWRSLEELKAIKSGVISDGQNYWCLSSLAPKGAGAIACSENGWVSAIVNERKVLFSCITDNGKQIQLYDAGRTIDYRFGKPGATPELELQVPRDRASTYQWSGFGRTMSYSVDVPNGDTIYQVFWGLDRLSQNKAIEAGVNVIVKEKPIATVNCASEIESYLRGVDLPPTQF